MLFISQVRCIFNYHSSLNGKYPDDSQALNDHPPMRKPHWPDWPVGLVLHLRAHSDSIGVLATVAYSSPMEDTFNAFCDSVKKGSTRCTNKTLKKICSDCKIYCKGMDQNRVDIQFRKHLGKARLDVDYKEFCTFLENELADAYMEARKIDREAAIAELKSKITNGHPESHGVVAVSSDSATARLTDHRGYTGTHKERFDAETGKGKGKEGRENIPDKKAQQGYVGNYKNMDTYDKMHKK